VIISLCAWLVGLGPQGESMVGFGVPRHHSEVYVDVIL
jgi:hypothetical protein